MHLPISVRRVTLLGTSIPFKSAVVLQFTVCEAQKIPVDHTGRWTNHQDGISNLSSIKGANTFEGTSHSDRVPLGAFSSNSQILRRPRHYSKLFQFFNERRLESVPELKLP